MGTVGNYRILKAIGEGGFGRVYEAEHLILKTTACAKQNLAATPENVDLLRHEAQLLWKLDEYHSIPSVKDFHLIDATTAVMIMKHIEGKTLEEVVAKKGPLHPEDAAWVTERLLGALHYAHYHGVLHSDVKPENVFVEPRKRDIKLIDFGLGVYKPTSATKPLGYSPKYAAPELMAGNPPLPESDLYGAGIVMLRALGGDVAKKSFRTDTPKQLVKFCEELLRYNPQDRPNWEKDNPIVRLSDIRHAVFGRRHMSDDILKGGTD